MTFYFRKLLLTAIVVHFVSFTVFAQSDSADNAIVVSHGFGISSSEATEDAVRNAVEKSAGMFLSSQTIVENYAVVKDVIVSSANAYCYKYDELSSSHDPAQGIFRSEIKAYIARKLFQNELTLKLQAGSPIDMSQVEKVKYEMQQAKMRAKSSVAFTASFIQSSFRDAISFDFDSIQILEKDIVSGKATIAFDYSLSYSNQLRSFVNTLEHLLSRSREFSNKEYKVVFETDYSVQTSNSRNQPRHCYQFQVLNKACSNGIVSTDKKCMHLYSVSMGLYSNVSNRHVVRKFPIVPINQALCCFGSPISDSTPFVFFNNFQYSSSDIGVVQMIKDIDADNCQGVSLDRVNPRSVRPSHFNTLKFNHSDRYSNRINIALPINDIKEEMTSIEVTITMYELEATGKIARKWIVVDKNKNSHPLELFSGF